jgi:hypothetical protein
MLARLIFPALFTFVLIGGMVIAADRPPAFDGGGVVGLDLKTQLEKGLRARRPVEFEYIDQIVTLVEKGELPYKLVITTYGWAQFKPTRQLQYFQLALQARTRGLNIDMPDLNKQAVGISSNGGFHGFNTPPIPAR